MDIPGYTIQRTIGKGGMGTVYLAIQQSLDRPVVLKVMSPEDSENPDSVERFLNEGRIIAALRHPNIITIYDIGTVENIWFISMEYVEGGDLKQKLEKSATVTESLDMLVKIGSALDLAHQNGVVHRDVKTANILYRTDGTPLLTDFGIAKYAKADAELTSTGTILGSPFYMSTEQAEGIEVDGRTDIYSLGVIFFEMLTGERPYLGDTAIKIIMRHLQSPIPRLPEDLARFQPLLERMLAKDRERRFADAADLVDAAVVLQKEESAQKTREKKDGVSIVPDGAPSAAIPGTGVAYPSYGFSGKRAFAEVIGGILLLVAGFFSFFIYSQSIKKTSVAEHVFQEIDRTPQLVAESGGEDATANSAKAGAVRRKASVDKLGNPKGLDISRLTDGKKNKTERVKKALIWLAEDSLRSDKLTTPAADNAYYYFSRLLEIDKDNEVALDGIARVAERFVVLAEKHFSNKNYQQAQAYIQLGLTVEPKNKGLLQLRSFIGQRQTSLLADLVDFLASNR